MPLHAIPDEWRGDLAYTRWVLGLGWYGFGYWMRALFIDPAPSFDRCVMGGPVHPWVWCPRYAEADELWCDKHRPPLERIVEIRQGTV